MTWDTDANNVLRGDRNLEQDGYKNGKEEQGRETCQKPSVCVYTGQRGSW